MIRRRCCVLFDLYKGSIVIGIFSILLNMTILIFGIYVSLFFNTYEYLSNRVIYYVTTILCFHSFSLIVSDFCLLYGLMKKLSKVVKIWLIFNVVYVILWLILNTGVVVYTSTTTTFRFSEPILFSILFLFLILYGFFLSVIWFYYRSISK